MKKWIKEIEIKRGSTFEMLTMAVGECTMSRTQLQLWYNRFKEGREDFLLYEKMDQRN